MMDADQMRYEEPQRAISDAEISDILGSIRLERPSLFADAQAVFTRFVDPRTLHDDGVMSPDVVAMNMLFAEWLFYDHELGMELSPLQLYSMAEPAVEEYADTQFFSQFWVISQNRRTGEVRLRDTRTCRNFDVIDKEIACQRAWAHGLIGVRLAQVDGAWLTCGKFRPHDNCRSKPRPASHGSLRDRGYDRLALLKLGAKVIGMDGEHRASAAEFVATG